MDDEGRRPVEKMNRPDVFKLMDQRPDWKRSDDGDG